MGSVSAVRCVSGAIACALIACSGTPDPPRVDGHVHGTRVDDGTPSTHPSTSVDTLSPGCVLEEVASFGTSSRTRELLDAHGSVRYVQGDVGITTFGYDGGGRLTSNIGPNIGDRQFVYDGATMRLLQSGVLSESYTLDARDRVIGQTSPNVQTWTFDDAGRVLDWTTIGVHDHYDFDAAGLLKHYTREGSGSCDIDYVWTDGTNSLAVSGTVTGQPPSITCTYAFDGDSRLSSATCRSMFDVQSATYTYAADGWITVAYGYGGSTARVQRFDAACSQPPKHAEVGRLFVGGNIARDPRTDARASLTQMPVPLPSKLCSSFEG